MRIAIVAWGSLVWQPANAHGELAVADASMWRHDGPRLPIEFARISSDGRLTLVVLPDEAKPVVTLWRRSAFDGLTDAITNLAARETNAPLDRIHAVDTSGSVNGDPDPRVTDGVRGWLDSRSDVDAAIWTGLPPGHRWVDLGYGRFSPQAAIDYLASLEGNTRARAAEYIQRAPITTDLRPRLERVLATG